MASSAYIFNAAIYIYIYIYNKLVVYSVNRKTNLDIDLKKITLINIC